ncbi:MAG: Cell division integral membrane protein, YggT and half-length relatives [uncultured Nocardioidaceae bacterium]|uniref:Cell division integral membrane protein, YggT and half-length relatives n=1 Tax=uncultured Nocardioidaceae bacterium TaxID=253824 RepID=A0A6J4KX59_9ACTN|nr:MAG: Cell division integral membrane protein, YggT and half-length relatives [uncultured Nocardioidaceae bacterium]
MQIVGEILGFVLWIALIVLIARIVLDYVQMLARDWRPSGPVLVLAEVIYSLTDPPLRAVRRVLPPIRLGAVMLDLSPLVLFVIIYLLRALVAVIFL